MHTITLTANPSDEDVKFVQDGLLAYNRQHAPDDGHQRIALFAKTDDARIIGGLLGDTYWGWMYISILWLDETVRGQGLGSQLLASAEAEARNRGCHHVHVDTMSFQALPFYEKYGYEVYGVLDDMPIGYKRYFLKKTL